MAQKLESADELMQFVSGFDVFLFDCDGMSALMAVTDGKVCYGVGTLYSGIRARRLNGCGQELVFVTNNSAKSRSSYKKKLNSMGIPAEIEEIFPSSYSSAVYLRRVLKLPSDQRVYVIGGSGIMEECEAEGIQAFGGPDESEREAMTDADFKKMQEPDPSVGAVLCGIDVHISYRKLCRAYRYLLDPACHFLLTNQDSTYPTHGDTFPGAGAISYPLIYSTRRTPKILGKPAGEMLDAVEAVFQFDRSRACFVGDRLDTDIQFAQNSNLGGSLLVLTGISNEQEVLADDAPVRPTHYCEYLGQIYEAAQTNGK